MSTLRRKFLRFQQFTSSGTWTKRPDVRAILVVCIGGGRGLTGNGGNSSFSTCVGTGGGTAGGGTSGSGGDLNLTSGHSVIEGGGTYAAGCNVFGMEGNSVGAISGQSGTGCASGTVQAAPRSSGGAAMRLFDVETLPETVAVTVGAAGAGGSPVPTSGQVWIYEVS